MSNLGPRWQDDEDYSPARMDAKTIVRDTGTNIMAIAVSRQIAAACPTDTSAGLVKNVLYVVDYDTNFNRLSFTPVFHKHTHSDVDTHETGGSMLNMSLANTAEFFDLILPPVTEIFQISTVGTGPAATYDASPKNKIKLDTGATSGNTISASLGGIFCDWSSQLVVQFRGNLGSGMGTNLLTRFGSGTDRIEDAQDTARRQMGIEGCDGHGVNWVIINANGGASSLTVTSTTAALDVAGSPAIYKLVHTPASSVVFSVDGTTIATSSTNVASSGSGDSARLLIFGIKTTTGSSRSFYFRNGRITGDPQSFK